MMLDDDEDCRNGGEHVFSTMLDSSSADDESFSYRYYDLATDDDDDAWSSCSSSTCQSDSDPSDDEGRGDTDQSHHDAGTRSQRSDNEEEKCPSTLTWAYLSTLSERDIMQSGHAPSWTSATSRVAPPRVHYFRWKLIQLILQSSAKLNGNDNDETVWELKGMMSKCRSYQLYLCQQDDDGVLLLHFAVMVGAALDVIKILADEYPRAIIHGYSNVPPHLRDIGIRHIRSFERSAIWIATDGDPVVRKWLIERAVQYLLQDSDSGLLLDDDMQEFFVGHLACEDVVGCLLDNIPSFFMRQISFEDGSSYLKELPLHFAVRAGAPTKVLRRIVSANPHALLEGDSHGKTPLHSALEVTSTASLNQDVIQLLARPAVLGARDKGGQLPLHVICNQLNRHLLTLQVLRLLVDPYPGSIKEQDLKGRTPLHVLCEGAGDEQLPLIQYSVDRFREYLDVETNMGSTPLAETCLYSSLYNLEGNQSKFLLIKWLVEARPGTMKRQDCLGRSPLHNLCHFGTKADVESIIFITDMFPELLKAKDRGGNTPLHLACKGSYVDHEVILCLLQRCSDLLESSDGDMYTPLHALCFSRNISLDSLRLRFKSLAISTKAVKVKSRYGNKNAFHLLAERGAHTFLLNILKTVCPDVVLERDKDGRTPLHGAIATYVLGERTVDPDDDSSDEPSTIFALSSEDDDSECQIMGRHSDAVTYLLEAFPAAANMLDNEKMTPLMTACEAGGSVDLIYRLVRSDPVANLGFGT